MINISPKYQMELISEIQKTIWALYGNYNYTKALYYIKKWHDSGGDHFNDYWENFSIEQDKSNNNHINLEATLHNIPGETLISIAIDLDIDTPGYIPLFPKFKNDLKSAYVTAYKSFEKAAKNVEEDPDLAVGLANSALESIIKHILDDKNLEQEVNKKDTLYKLTSQLLKAFSLYPDGKNSNMPEEINNIGSALLKLNQNIESLRSIKTSVHGKLNSDYVINESLYAYFVINSVATIGMFLKDFYELKYKPILEKKQGQQNIQDDLPF